jgi:hypothetical protein
MMTPQEMEEKKEAVQADCICRNCPTWEDCGEKGGFCFPTTGKSTCITEEKGCLCKACPVYGQISLTKMYYCTKGSEKDQSGM